MALRSMKYEALRNRIYPYRERSFDKEKGETGWQTMKWEVACFQRLVTECILDF